MHAAPSLVNHVLPLIQPWSPGLTDPATRPKETGRYGGTGAFLRRRVRLCVCVCARTCVDVGPGS